MALTLRDVVENRAQERAAGVRNAPSTTRDAGEARRERFSIDEPGPRDASDAPARSSSSARKDAAKTDAPKSDASGAQDKPAQAEPSSPAAADRAAQPGPAKEPAAAGQAVPVKPAAPVKPIKPADGMAASVPADTETSQTTATEAGTEGSKGTGDTSMPATAGTDPAAAAATTSPMMVVFMAPPAVPPPILPPSSTPAVKAGGSKTEGESEVSATDGTAKGASVPDLATGTARNGVSAAASGFETALAEIGAGAPGGAATPSVPPPGADASAAPASPSADAKATAASTAAQLPAPPSAPSAPVPLGAVPMTIGLRALGASNRFEIRLDPKELGRIDVSLDIDKDSGTVGARLVVDRPETLALLQRDASSLQQALAQTGLDASAGISLSLRGGDAEGRRNGGEPGSEAQARGSSQHDHAGAQAGNDTNPVALVPLHAMRGLGRVDLRI